MSDKKGLSDLSREMIRAVIGTPAAPTEAPAQEPLTIPSIWRIDKCKRHEDYVESCAGCQEEILTVKTEQAYRAGFKAVAAPQAESAGKPDAVEEFFKHWPEIGTIPVALEKAILRFAEAYSAKLRAELEQYTENKRIATCVDCKGSIWFREARIEDETGIYHPLCRVLKQKEAAESSVTRLTREREELQQKYDKVWNESSLVVVRAEGYLTRAETAERERDQAREALEAARCIHHWHDWGKDNEGMVVSAEHVRKLWDALAKYDKLAALVPANAEKEK